MQNKKKSSIMKDAFALFAITLVASVALGFVYEITKDVIARKQAEAKATAYATVFQEAKLVDDTNEELILEVEVSSEFLANHGFKQTVIDEVCIAKDENGNPIGYVLTATSREGYAGDIQISLGVRADGTLTKMEILSIKETAGLGMEAQNESFKSQYSEVKTDAFTVIKGTKTADHEIVAISSATVTSDAITNTVNASLAFVNELLDKEVGGVVRE